MGYSNLVFEGGGVKGIAYAGAYQAMENFGLLGGIQRVAGTSAGAITAALVSMRVSPAEVKNVIATTDFKSFEDGWDPLRIATKYGLYKGDAFLTWMQGLIAKQGLKPHATFIDFKSSGCHDLHVFATDLTEQCIREFSFATTPTVPVCEAVRASMSIPLFFSAWQFPGGIPNNHLYVDGGTVFNYPITTFDKGNVPNPETIGFHLDNMGKVPPPKDLEFNHILKYTKALFDTLLNVQVLEFERDPTDMARSVKIDDFGISATDFGLTQAQIEQLYQSGLSATMAYLQARGQGVARMGNA